MKAIKPKSNLTRKRGASRAESERRRLLKEFFLNASLLAVMKETVEEAVELEQWERALARAEEQTISAPAA